LGNKHFKSQDGRYIADGLWATPMARRSNMFNPALQNMVNFRGGPPVLERTIKPRPRQHTLAGYGAGLGRWRAGKY
jgi:hypothetical protein